jgi:YHS domain-containing protein
VGIAAALRTSTTISEVRHLDPVCRMLVAEGRDAGTLRHEGTLHRFCSLECARRFLEDPEAYIPERGV